MNYCEYQIGLCLFSVDIDPFLTVRRTVTLSPKKRSHTLRKWSCIIRYYIQIQSTSLERFSPLGLFFNVLGLSINHKAKVISQVSVGVQKLLSCIFVIVDQKQVLGQRRQLRSAVALYRETQCLIHLTKNPAALPPATRKQGNQFITITPESRGKKGLFPALSWLKVVRCLAQ